MGLLVLLTGFALVTLSGTAFSAQKVEKQKAVKTDANKTNKNIQRTTKMPKGPDRMVMPSHSIKVVVKGEDAVRGRRIRITITKRGGGSQNQVKHLDRNGDAEHRFLLGSIAARAHGHYTITVAKVDGGHESYASEANWCFDYTDPASDGVDVDAVRRNVTSEEFNIFYNLLFDGSRVCW
jgi:hypothetical protein